MQHLGVQILLCGALSLGYFLQFLVEMLDEVIQSNYMHVFGQSSESW